MTIAQIAAIIIFVVMFAAIISDKVHRFIPAVAGGLLTMVVVFLIIERDPGMIWSVLNLQQLPDPQFWWPGGHHADSPGVNWQTLIFIGGMMAMVEGLGEVGFFRWICLILARAVKCRVVPLLIAFMLLSGFLSMFIDSITVLLFLAMVTIELSRQLKFDPIPIILAEIFAANVGGSATMSGDPPNIIIGTSLGYSFTDFLMNTGAIAWIGMVVAIIIFYFAFRKSLRRSQTESSEELMASCPLPVSAITNRKDFYVNTGIFLIVIVLLITHAETGMSVALIGVIAAAMTLLYAGRKAPHLIKGIDWRTLLFFVGLFLTVGGLEETGVLEMVAHWIAEVSGGNIVIVIPLILWISAVASALVDNIPFAATMVPVIKNLAATAGLNLETMAWTLALGCDIGGNATPIGASANVVGTAIAAREGHPISWGRYLKVMLPATIVVVAICMGLLWAWHV
jgi:Na+/H+ antiporter NhaD/arsenite permease-like protein